MTIKKLAVRHSKNNMRLRFILVVEVKNKRIDNKVDNILQ